MAKQVGLRVFSGIQPTGKLHLGNYFGAVKRWVDGLETETSLNRDQRLFSVVDLHAITLPQDPKVLRTNIVGMATMLLSCGLDPKKCILFQQSSVREHTELAWILGCHTTVPNLSRLTQYKEKAAKLKEIPLGLFVYPVLQAADILLYKATEVPVGEDNVQNIQIAQQISRSFNYQHQEIFPYPKIVLVQENNISRVKSLRTPEKKMSKSDPYKKACIYIDDTPEDVLEKCKKAITDFISEVTYDPVERPGVSNLISLHRACTGQSIEEIVEQSKGLNTGQYKLQLAEVINAELQPIRQKISEFGQNPHEVERILAEGADQARSIAQDTMKEVRKLSTEDAQYKGCFFRDPLTLNRLRKAFLLENMEKELENKTDTAEWKLEEC